MATKTKLQIVKNDKFNLITCGAEIAEDVVQMRSAESARASLNKHLGEAYAAGIKWGRATQEGTLGAILSDALKKRGLTDGSIRTTLCTLKFCFENKVRVDDLTLSRVKDMAKKGSTVDLITGEPKKVKVEESGKGKGGKGGKGGKVKTEKTVVHAGIGILKALESEGFVKWLNHLLDAAEIRGVDSSSLDEIKLDLVRDTLKECGYAIQDEKGDWVAAIIKESDDEAEEV